ncbi:MAG: tetratricopeptide repeat protein [Marinobacterium sp.]|nr:tetratricopeptide repeat protein [Marinobacterium sp.]
MKTERLLALVVTAGVLAGCAGQSYRVPVEERNRLPSAAPSVEPAPGVIVTPVTPVDIQSQPLSPRASDLPANRSRDIAEQPGRNPAVIALLGAAQQQRDRGSMRAAQSSLERALRISPRDPEVYYQLADLQRRQNNFRQAEQLALRGLEVASGKPGMQRSLWVLVSSARKSMGDMGGYRQALEKARQY